MKNSILIFLACCFFVFSANAQVQTLDETNKRVGINNTAPEYTMHLKHANKAASTGGKEGLALTNIGSNKTWQFYVGNDGGLQFCSDGGAIEAKMTVDGTMDLISDSTRKTAIAPMPDGQLKEILQLQAKQYRYKEQKGNKLQFGFIAQEVAEVYPILVSIDKDEKGKETYMMNYIGLVPFLVKAMQEQQALIAEKDAEIESLRAQQVGIELRIARLEAAIAPAGAASSEAAAGK